MRPLVLGGFLFASLAVCAGVYGEDPNPPTIRSTRGAWPIRRQWTPAETRHFARWMANIYQFKTKGTVEQRIAKLERVLTDPEMNLLLDPEFLGEGSNPQLPKSIRRSAHNVLDCAKFTSFMPAYYAYRRALPWMTARVRSGGGDIRTADANIPIGSTNSFTSPSLSWFFQNGPLCYTSGNYRVEPYGKGSDLSDTAPVALDPKFLMPGCMNYTDGHCLLLAHVSEYGELEFLNCSTTTTRDIFSYNGMNTVSGISPRGYDPNNEWAGCFQGLRVWRYPIAETNAQGRVIKVRRRTDEEMAAFGFSTEQYTRIQEISEKHKISEGGLEPRSFHDFIRLRMRTVDTIAPLTFMEEYAGDLLGVYELREEFVQDAWRNHQAHGPVVYPEERKNENIFQANGRWETWSSPSSDVDRRNKYFYLATWMDYAIRWFAIQPEAVDLTGLEAYEIRSQSGLAHALIEEKERIFAEKTMQYTKSNGDKVPLTLLDVEDRLYDLSFDPNHPPELRWGAPAGSVERASAPSTPTPVPGGALVPMEDAYRWQAYYRSLSQRETFESSLRRMFTDGFPIRDRFAEQLSKWFYSEEPVVLPEPEPVENGPPPPPLVPAGHPLGGLAKQPGQQ